MLQLKTFEFLTNPVFENLTISVFEYLTIPTEKPFLVLTVDPLHKDLRSKGLKYEENLQDDKTAN